MTLVPATGVVRTIAKAAAVDPEGTSELVRLALFETLCDFVEADRDEITAAFSKSMTKQNGELRRAMVREYIAKRMDGGDVDSLQQAAEYWNAVVKALPWDRKKNRGDWDETKVHRDFHGRFARTLSGDGHRQSQQKLADTVSQLVNSGAVKPGDEMTVLARAAARNGKAIGRLGGSGMQQIDMQVPQHRGALEYEMNHGKLAGYVPDHVAVGSQGQLADGSNRANAFDAVRAVAGSGAALRASQLPLDGDDFGAALGTLNSGSRYQRAALVGSALSNQTSPGSTPHTVGVMAQLVGNLGPQAETVLGDNIKRTAYRYRGTEKRPSQELIDDVEGTGDTELKAIRSGNLPAIAERARLADQTSRALAAPRRQDRSDQGRAAEVPRSTTERLATYWANPRNQQARNVDPSTDALELRMRGDAAVGYFMRRLPNPREATLSAAGGGMPPSIGAIIDEKGNVVTESQGFAHDSYLPFDLKNLKRLQGGQYVRTRVGGGPSGEDIYTGLLAGARQVQVVSNSGVFTVEFDPDLRGGRRYSDKARAMINRYNSILEAIAQPRDEKDKLYANDLPAWQKAAIRRKAYEENDYDEAIAEPIAQRALERERRVQQLGGDEEEERNKIRGRVRTSNPDWGPSQVEAEVEDQYYRGRRQLEETKVRPLQLNGEGYNRALLALQQEFPYYIRAVDYQPLRDFGRERGFRGPGGGPFGGSPNFPDPNYRALGTTKPRAARGGEGGEAEGRTVGTRTPTGGQPPSGGATAAAGELPSKIVAPKPVNDVAPLSELSKRQNDFKQPVSDSMSNLDSLIQGAFNISGDSIDETGHDVDLSKYSARTAPTYFMALLSKAGSWGKMANLLVDPNEVTDDQAQTVVAKAEELLQTNSVVQTPNGGQYTNDAAIKTAVENLKKLVLSRRAFSDPAADPATYDPDSDSGLPQRFTAIDRLGVDSDNYAHFINALSNQTPANHMIQEIGTLGSLDDKARRQHVKDAVTRYQKLVEWGSNGAPSNRVPSGFQVSDRAAAIDAAAGVADPRKPQVERDKLLATQAAWSFVHARDIAHSVNPPKAGGGAPFAPAALPAAPPRQPPDQGLPPRKGQGTQARKPRNGQGGEARKSLTKRDVPWHPPGQDGAFRFAKALLETMVEPSLRD
jgi:hypothetical protein